MKIRKFLVISVRNCDNNSPEINEDNSPHQGTRLVLAPDAAAAARLATRATTPVHTAPLGMVPGIYDAIAADVDECSVLVLDLAILADQLGQCQADLLQ